jgi:sarcosine oxidase/L-pipecolate oxidase
MFMIPPHNRELKLGRHGFGYQNPVKVSLATGAGKTTHALVSVPRTDLPVPAEAEKACREFLVELFPQFKKKTFTKTRVCWYCDT